MQDNKDFDLKKLENIVKNKKLKDLERLKASEIEKIKKFDWLF